MKQKFDEIAWIENFFAPVGNLDYQHLRPILCFSLMWNAFETLICNGMDSPTNIEKSVRSAVEGGHLSETAKYLPFLNYVKQTHLASSSLEDMLDRLQVSERNRGVIRQAVSSGNPTVEQIVHGLLLIANRIRNNLFHGNEVKNIESLPAQTELFHKVNEFLAAYLEDIGRTQIGR